MTTPVRVAAVTGASGYLGSRISTALESRGWRVVRLGRTPKPGSSARYELGNTLHHETIDVLRSVDTLIHAAYDLSLTRSADIWRINVAGTQHLLNAARNAGTDRVIVLSSMSAYAGTRQLYGRAKLDIEAMTHELGGCAVRPGLVYGEGSGGMAGMLRKLSRLPVVPVIAGGSGLYTVHESDLTAAIAALAESPDLPNETVSVAHPAAISIREILRTFAAQEGRRCRFLPVPWQAVYAALRAGETARLPMPFRADSLLGLVRGAPSVVNTEPVTKLGVTIRAFGAKPESVGTDRQKR